MLEEVHVAPRPLERFAETLDEPDYAGFIAAGERGRELLHGRSVFNVNSTAHGGGVAEMLQPLLAYARAAGIDARWLVIEGDPDFFAVTKRLHNRLHGSAGDGGELGAEQREAYERTSARNASAMSELVHAGDVVILHDPQTAGLAEPLRAAGARVVWRSHVGLDAPNEHARAAWEFLGPYVAQAERFVFSRVEHVWEGLDTGHVTVIPPSIDAFSPKNQELDAGQVAAILDACGLVPGGGGGEPAFERIDGSPGRVDRHAECVQEAPPRPADPLVVQVSRWDRLKDPLGLIEAFAGDLPDEAHLLLAGPAVAAVSDDPEGLEVWEEAQAAWRELSAAARERVHLCCLPMDDIEENAAIVNALQRHATVVVQKSLAEGFGLTVAEAMWKAQPVVASRIGGIQDQIEHERSGLLLDDPRDGAELARALDRLFADREWARALGEAARERVRRHYLGARHLLQYFGLVAALLADSGQTGTGAE